MELSSKTCMKSNVNKALIYLFLLTFAVGLDAQNQAENTFLWPENLRDQVRQDIFTRSKGRVLLEIPVLGRPVQFHISANSYIKSDQSLQGSIYQAFSGRDSVDNPVFGYYYQDQIRPIKKKIYTSLLRREIRSLLEKSFVLSRRFRN